MKRCAYLLLMVVPGLLFFMPQGASAKIYVDINSPGFRQFPVAMYDFSQDSMGQEITKTVKDDLEFTGLFHFVDKAAFIESKTDDFNRKNWIPLGVDAVLKGDVTASDKVKVSIKFYDVVESSVILSKQYSADRNMIELLAHTISDDVYYALTGQKGIFRSKIAFVADKGNAKDLMVIDYDGRRLQRLGFSRPLMLAPHWAKDRTKIVLTVMEGGQWCIYLIDLRDMKARKVFFAEGINIAGDFSPSGDSFVFSSSQAGSPNIYLFNLKTGLAKKISSSYWIDISPSFSPDGTQIVFVSNKSGNPHIYLMDVNGYNIQRVTFSGTYNTSPKWSPSGDLIAFSGMIAGKNQVFTVRPDGTDIKQLTDRGNNEDPVFSPDGRFLAFTSDRSGQKAVYIMTAGGENQKQVSPAGYRAFGPEWY